MYCDNICIGVLRAEKIKFTPKLHPKCTKLLGKTMGTSNHYGVKKEICWKI